MSDALKPASIAIDDASHTLRDYIGKLEADPQRLEAIETRMAAIEKLKRKYGGTLDEILAFLDTVRQQLNAIETAGERRASLEKERERLRTAFKSVSAKLTSLRKESSRKLSKKVESELASLAMSAAVFEVRVTDADWSAHGADTIEFLISANVGEEPKPLDKVASGGELSRVALALKTCTMPGVAANRSKQPPRTLVFDEVDAGIGGGAADAVGRKLKKLAAQEQVLCVTHLAQVASYADHHYFVDKRSERGRTFTTIDELDRPGRTREIGRMLSGERLTPEALKHAEQMIKAGAGAG
jgi:DNA repair protein RecN (Recombination protein N)